jgi:hypothetical protein
VHDLGLSDAWELSATLGKVSYEVPERLARLLGARLQVPGVSRMHVPWKFRMNVRTKSSQLWI